MLQKFNMEAEQATAMLRFKYTDEQTANQWHWVSATTLCDDATYWFKKKKKEYAQTNSRGRGSHLQAPGCLFNAWQVDDWLRATEHNWKSASVPCDL